MVAYVTRFTGTPVAAEPHLIASWGWYPPGRPLPGPLFQPTLD